MGHEVLYHSINKPRRILRIFELLLELPFLIPVHSPKSSPEFFRFLSKIFEFFLIRVFQLIPPQLVLQPVEQSLNNLLQSGEIASMPNRREPRKTKKSRSGEANR